MGIRKRTGYFSRGNSNHCQDECACDVVRICHTPVYLERNVSIALTAAELLVAWVIFLRLTKSAEQRD